MQQGEGPAVMVVDDGGKARGIPRHERLRIMAQGRTRKRKPELLEQAELRANVRAPVRAQVEAGLGDMKAIVGLGATYGNNEAILIDVSGPKAALKVQELVEDAVMVSPCERIIQIHDAKANRTRHVLEDRSV